MWKTCPLCGKDMGEADRQRTIIGTDIPSSQYRLLSRSPLLIPSPSLL
jgi:hypothetical protein